MEYKYDVFISYSSKDYLDDKGKEIPGNIISVIKTLLQYNGVKYWIDQKENLTGKMLTHTFSERINESQMVLFVCSKNAVDSIWVERELSVAFNSGKPIIPFVCDDSYMNDKFSIYTVPIGCAMYYRNQQKALEDLIACIKANMVKAENVDKETKRPIFTKIQMDDHWGLANEAGKIVVPCKYNAVTYFQEGLACVESDKRKWGFVDENGNEVIPCKWEDVGFFSEGLAYAEDAFGRIGFIDKSGKVVIPCQWEDAAPFLNGKAFVKDKEGTWHQINKAGTILDT